MANNLPEVGSMVHSVSGPSFELNGVVIAHSENRWGSFALVMMHNGKIERCDGLNDGPGIGWHAGSHRGGYNTEIPDMDYSNYD